MKDVFTRIEKMHRQQRDAAGPMFAKLSTSETWIELLRWLVQEKSDDFQTQMLEVAALATWALEASRAEIGKNEMEEEGLAAMDWDDGPLNLSHAPRFFWTSEN